MASSKRNFSDFLNFGGKYSGSVYKFKKLTNLDSLNRKRNWQIFIRLVEDGKRQTNIDWDSGDEKEFTIKKQYIENNDHLPDNIIAQIWTETGIDNGKQTKQIPTYIDEGKCIGRKNQRNILQNAMIIARKEFLKRQERSSATSTALEGFNGIDITNEQKDELKSTISKMKYLMLAKKWKDGAKHLTESNMYIQPKLDGVRCCAFYDEDAKKVILYSRTKKPWLSLNFLRKSLKKTLKAFSRPGSRLYLDGELYNHGTPLQVISGVCRKDNPCENDHKIQFHIYDCFFEDDNGAPFKDRHKQLIEIKNYISNIRNDKIKYKKSNHVKKISDIVKFVDTIKVTSINEGKEQYEKFVKLEYEGVMFRNANGVYLNHNTKRSNNLVKMKVSYDAEFKIVGFTQGKRGRSKGAIIWICETPDEKHKFNVTPNETYEKRYDLYKKATNNFDQFEGKNLKVYYEEMSTNNVPQRAKGIEIRDYE